MAIIEITDKARVHALLADDPITTLDALDAELGAAGVAETTREFNMTWHDWLNLRNLVAVSKAICAAAAARTDSRGAHFRADHPATGDLATSRYTLVRREGAGLAVAEAPVAFTRVRPGESLLGRAAE